MGRSQRPVPDPAGAVASGSRRSRGNASRNLRIPSQDPARCQQLDSLRRRAIPRSPRIRRQRHPRRSPTGDSARDGERRHRQRGRGGLFPVGRAPGRGVGASTPGPPPGFPAGWRPYPHGTGGTRPGQQQQRLSAKPRRHAGIAASPIGPLHGPRHRFRRRRRRPEFLPPHHGAHSLCDPTVPRGRASGRRGGSAVGRLQSGRSNQDSAPRGSATPRRRLSGPDDPDAPGSGPQPGQDRRGTPR